MNEWKSVWNHREGTLEEIKENDFYENFLQLKRLMGITNLNKSKQKGEYRAGYDQFLRMVRELSFSSVNEKMPESFFDVGCGTGSYLYLLQSREFVEDVGCCKIMPKIGGVDYSSHFIDIAQKVLQNPEELYCAEASELNIDIKYDVVYSRSIFQYFYDVEYAREVLCKMLCKANRSVGVFDVHDLKKRADFLEYRRSVIENYDEKYANTPHLFLGKEMFIEIAEEYACDLKFSVSGSKTYWNTPFTYDVYLFKRN